MDTDLQEFEGSLPDGPEPAVSIQAQAASATETETPLMLTDSVCGLACRLGGGVRPG